MSQNMKTFLPNTKFYNFSRKFSQVTALSGTFGFFGGGIGGQKFHWGPLGTAPAFIQRFAYFVAEKQSYVSFLQRS